VEREQDEQMAFDRCAARLNVVMDALRDALGDDGQLATQGVNVTPHWEEGREQGVEAMAWLTVSVPVERAGEVARVAMSAGGARVAGPRFRAGATAEVHEELIAEAVEAARRKAERAAGAAGRSLGRALLVAEEGGGGPVPIHGAPGAAIHTLAQPQIEPVEQLVTAAVWVTYELEG
jgi:uncharacterized protein YggE